jgi:hypothetical protein
LPVGTVTRVGSGKDLFLSIRIKPAANLSRLEEVLVLTEKQERESVADDHVRIRAADILAQRLPSVPDKPATAVTPPAVAEGASPRPVGGNTAAKPAGTAAGNAAALKSASGNTPAKSATLQVQPGKTAVQPSTQSSAQTSTAPKPKPLSKSSTEAKPDGAQSQPPAQPSIVEQKPAPVAAQPDTPPPSQDNSPQ